MNIEINAFKEDIELFNTLMDNYKSLVQEDGDTAFKLAQMMIVLADRFSEICLNVSKYAKEYCIAKTDLYNWAYQKYRILMTTHEFCRVVWKQCCDNERKRWNES